MIVSCAAGQEGVFETDLAGQGAEIVTVPETEPMGRGGGLRLATQAREETGPLYVLNGDELIDVDLAALLSAHKAHGAAATIVVAPLPTAFGVVEIEDDDRVTGFQDSPRAPVLGACGRERLRRRGAGAASRRRATTSRRRCPHLAAEGKLYALSPLRALADGQHA